MLCIYDEVHLIAMMIPGSMLTRNLTARSKEGDMDSSPAVALQVSGQYCDLR